MKDKEQFKTTTVNLLVNRETEEIIAAYQAGKLSSIDDRTHFVIQLSAKEIEQIARISLNHIRDAHNSKSSS